MSTAHVTSKTRRTLRALGLWPDDEIAGAAHVEDPAECVGVWKGEPCGRNAMLFDEFCARPDHDVWTLEEIEDIRKRAHERFIRMGWEQRS